MRFIGTLIGYILGLAFVIGWIALTIYVIGTFGAFGAAVMFILSFLIYRRMDRKDRMARKAQKRAEKEYMKANGIGTSFGDILLCILLFPIMIPWKLLKLIIGYNKSEKEKARNWLAGYQSEMAADAANYNARKAQKQQMLNRAYDLEDEMKYQSGARRRDTQREIDRLKRDAGRL